MKVITWNINGLRAGLECFFDYLADADADIIAIQETRVTEPVRDLDGLGYAVAWNIAAQQGYAGTAILYRHPPINIKYGLGVKEIDKDARVISLEYQEYYVVTVYVPNSQTYFDKMDFRQDFDRAFLKYIDKLRHKKNIILCGDFNVAREHLDIFPENTRNPEEQYGYLSEERENFETLLNLGLIDAFRYINPADRVYTWWSQKHPRSENKGRRLDYFLVSENLIPYVKGCRIRPEIPGSDHAPVEMDIDL
jgi:exodeoxyribonuclease III